MTSKRLALKIGKIAEEKKAQDIVLLDIHNLSVVCDYFLICSGESPVHIRAIAKALEENIAQKEVTLLNPGNCVDKKWTLLDFGEVVVHIFSPEARKYYQLERLWADAEKEEISDFSQAANRVNI